MLKKEKDPFKVLGLKPNASIIEVKEAFRKLALAFHPDRDSSYLHRSYLTEKMKDLNFAYSEAKKLLELKKQPEKEAATKDIINSCDKKEKSWSNYYPWFCLFLMVVASPFLPIYNNPPLVMIFAWCLLFLNLLIFLPFVILFFLCFLWAVFLPIILFAEVFAESYEKTKSKSKVKISKNDLLKGFIKRAVLVILFIACFPLFNYLGFNQDLPYILLLLAVGNALGELAGLFYWLFQGKKHEEALQRNLEDALKIVSD